MELEFYGATGTVTGSLHCVRAGGLTILLDCGLFQGKRAESFRRNSDLPDFAVTADCLILSHAHIDHSGNIPNLIKSGFAGNVYATPATRDLASVMLRDSAYIQEQDAKFLNKRAAKAAREEGRPPPEEHAPLYTVADAVRSLDHFVSVPYRRRFPLNADVTFTFFDAGHILGSATVIIEEKQSDGSTKRLLFTGDLGRRDMPILHDPEFVDGVDFLITESTYGDRLHEARSAMDSHLAEEIRRVVDGGGKLFIPSFSLERAQEILLSLHVLEREKRIPILPVYLDSPLAIAVTEVFRLHPECFDTELSAMIAKREMPFFTERLSKVHTARESKEIMELEESAVIIAGSGMCENGRIRHHLFHGLGDVRNSVLLVGFQAPYTLGRRLRDGERKVRIFGEQIMVNARVRSLEGFSAHADRNDLLEFAAGLAGRHALKRIFLVHGESDAMHALREAYAERGLAAQVYIPESGERFPL